MTDQQPPNGGSFGEYRALIMSHMEASNRRQTALEQSIVDIRVEMGVLVVKVGLLVSLLMLGGGTAVTFVVIAVMRAATEG